MNRQSVLRIAWAALGALLFPAACNATQLVYHPVNPTFGGNPLNGTYLLSQAQAQGLGTKSGAAGPDLSGLENSLNNIGGGGDGSVIVIGGGSNGGGNAGNGGGATPELLKTNRGNIP